MGNPTWEKAEKLVHDFVRKDWDEDTLQVVGVARMALWFGTPGWVSASERIRALIDEMPSELWVDMQAEDILDSEPSAWETDDLDEDGEPVMQEPCWEDYVHLDHRAIATAVIGSDIVSNL